MQQSITIQKKPALNESSDYALLRQKGLEYIQQLGSKLWTDYNIHDPGITLLEALCYAITDLGYRTSLNIEDLIADKPDVPPGNKYDFNKQAFFTAREILIVNPCTVNDFRKLLIDINGVKNAWLKCRVCPCDDVYLYANCENSVLNYEQIGDDKPVIIQGLYDVLVEFEDEERTGNLNSGKIWYNFSFLSDGKYTSAEIEMRMPSWFAVEEEKEKYRDIRKKAVKITNISVDYISANKADNANIPATPESLLDNALKGPVYVTVTVRYHFSGDMTLYELVFSDVPVIVWFRSNADRKNIQLADIKKAIQDKSVSGIIPKYIEKIKSADKIIADTSAALHSHRNLCEDYCSIKAIEVEDIAVCADMEVEPSADIEAVLAEAYYLIDQYFSPDLKFYSLQELLDAKKPVDEIFEGPSLSNGFINDEQLESTNLKKFLYTSDIINLLMDIKGVVSVKNLVLVRYDADGNIALKEDPKSPGKFIPCLESWSMHVAYKHQPRLYIKASKVLVYKNGLPFLPDTAEFMDTLQVIKGNHAQPKYTIAENNIDVPLGEWFDLESYYPVQYSLPLTYGVSAEGLPDSAPQNRKAEAAQLKAYLMFFEQLLANYLQQLANIKNLFAVDKAVENTYFSNLLGNDSISGISDIYAGLNEASLKALNETETVRLDRRNRLMDHILARFGEQFNDYALMLYSYKDSKAIADAQLINNKIDFIENFPFLSKNRGRALDYKDPHKVCNSTNIAGLQKRIELLLGLNEFDFSNYFELFEIANEDGKFIERRWRLIDGDGNIYLIGHANYIDSSREEAMEKAKAEIAKVYGCFTDTGRYFTRKNSKQQWVLELSDENNILIARHGTLFKYKKQAENARQITINYLKKISEREKLFVVEHVLLRPRYTIPQPFLFEIYEETDDDSKFFERRWRLIDIKRKIYFSGSTRYFDLDIDIAWQKAKQEIASVCKFLGNKDNYTIKFERTWHLNLIDDTNEVIATRIEKFDTEAEAAAARDLIIEKSMKFFWDGIDVESLMVNAGSDYSVFGRDPLLPVCLSADCSLCEEIDPYSFRLTVVVNGEDGIANNDIEFRHFAEQTIRLETPAHIGVKVCWVSKRQLLHFADAYCAWRSEIAKEEPDTMELHNRLINLLEIFKQLKNIYPPATLHDCIDGNDENRIYLNNTII